MAETAELIAEDESTANPDDVVPPVPEQVAADAAAPGDAVPDTVPPETSVPESPPNQPPAPPAQIEEPPKQEATQPEKAAREPLTCTAKLEDRYLIDGAEPLPHLDSPTALAYAVSDRDDPDANLFALMCTPGMPIRVDLIRKHRNSRIKGNIPILEWGYVFWEAEKAVVAAIIFEKPLGGNLNELIRTGTTRIGEYDVVQRVLVPAVDAISALIEAGVVHRAIRPDNLYFMDEDLTELVIGESVTTPPGYDQPIMYETISRSMTPPAGRGLGSNADDFYALGVTLVMILIGYNPLEKYSVLDTLAAKIEKGSYAAVCGNARLPISIIEVLRGMLADDENARWGTTQLDAWINGRKQSPMQRQGQKKASSPYSFDKHAHVSPRTLAYAFAANHEEAFRTLKSDENFESWLRRSLEDEEMADIYKALMDHAVSMAGAPTAEPDVVISRICMLLDPDGPIRYRGYAFMPDALGSAIAVEMMLNNDSQGISDIVSRDIFEFWFKAQPSNTTSIIEWQRTFVRCRGFLKIPDIGYGIERCLYELNDFIPCQSPMIIEENVVDSDELLSALDNISNKVESDARPVDRHIAAFIAARFVEDVHLHLKAVSAPTPERSVLGTLSLLAYLQYTHRSGPVLGLASWVGGLLGPVINTYQSRTTRRELEREIPQLVRKGSLPELFDLIENADRRKTDATMFTEAQAEFVACEDSILEIIGGEGERDSKILKSAQKATAMISILLSMTIVTMLFIVNVL